MVSLRLLNRGQEEDALSAAMCSTEISTESSVLGALSAFPATLQHGHHTKTGKESFNSFESWEGSGVCVCVRRIQE